MKQQYHPPRQVVYLNSWTTTKIKLGTWTMRLKRVPSPPCQVYLIPSQYSTCFYLGSWLGLAYLHPCGENSQSLVCFNLFIFIVYLVRGHWVVRLWYREFWLKTGVSGLLWMSTMSQTWAVVFRQTHSLITYLKSIITVI